MQDRAGECGVVKNVMCPSANSGRVAKFVSRVVFVSAEVN